MAIEKNVTYLNDLDPQSPGGGDPKSDGDDHMRNVKRALKNSIVGWAGAVMVAGTDGGAANAYTLTPDTPLVAYGAKMLALFVPVAANTGPATLNISGLGVKPVVAVSGAPLVSGDLVAGRMYSAFYDGTAFRLDAVTQNYIDQLVISGTVPGVNNPANAGKVFGTDGAAGKWVSLDGRGDPVYDNGTVASGTLTISHSNGEGQKAKAGGAHTLAATGFPAGRLAGVLLELTDYGAFPLTTTGITWIKNDGSETTSFAASGIIFPAAGRARVVLYSLGDGVVYGKAA